VEACSHIPNLQFPNYYEDLSSEQIITMDWMDGIHLSEFTAKNTNQELSNKLGQALWDFYLYQIYILKKVHADPHPGNFLVSKKGELIVIDFGCMKALPKEFHVPYFELLKKEVIDDPEVFSEKLYELEILRKEDSEEEIEFFTTLFHDVLELFTQPFNYEYFDFSDPEFFAEIASIGERYLKSSKIRSLNANRGSRHFIYMNRTFFGLFSLMFDLKAKNIDIQNFHSLKLPEFFV
jgi:predicted unusual protein kinase regulating ubiquinone biosynthesis (AarF/ABC1/UbiB family)